MVDMVRVEGGEEGMVPGVGVVVLEERLVGVGLQVDPVTGVSLLPAVVGAVCPLDLGAVVGGPPDRTTTPPRGATGVRQQEGATPLGDSRLEGVQLEVQVA